MTQKYQKGDLVRIAKDLGPSMGHFAADCDAIVIGSYRDQFGGSNDKSYTLFLKGRGSASWYDENHLSLIKTGQMTLLMEWEEELERQADQLGNLDWIFENGPQVLDNPTGASLESLAKCLGCDDMWGPAGEAYTYYMNSIAVIEAAKPYLLSGNKQGWLNCCSKFLEKQEKADG